MRHEGQYPVSCGRRQDVKDRKAINLPDAVIPTPGQPAARAACGGGTVFMYASPSSP
jgi:hypothetical protein